MNSLFTNPILFAQAKRLAEAIAETEDPKEKMTLMYELGTLHQNADRINANLKKLQAFLDDPEQVKRFAEAESDDEPEYKFVRGAKVRVK